MSNRRLMYGAELNSPTEIDLYYGYRRDIGRTKMNVEQVQEEQTNYIYIYLIISPKGTMIQNEHIKIMG